MEEKQKNKYTDNVVQELASRFELYYNELELVGTHQSLVYKGSRKISNVYLKIILSTHRSLSQLRAEIDMLLFLNEKNFNVALPIVSINDKYIESYTDNGNEFFAILFTEAEGLGVGKYPWTIEVPKRVGKMNAKLHNLLSNFKPTEFKRAEWFDNMFLVNADRYLPDNHEKVLSVINELMINISKLPKNEDNYGLIHGDMVACNYNMTDENITIFDFDEACYCWFINDIAVNLFYAALGWKGIVNVPDAIESFESYLLGYRSIRNIDPNMISNIGLFLKMREIILYIAIHRSRDLDNLDIWSKKFMEGRKERIENNIPFIDIDFNKYI